MFAESLGVFGEFKDWLQCRQLALVMFPTKKKTAALGPATATRSGCIQGIDEPIGSRSKGMFSFTHSLRLNWIW